MTNYQTNNKDRIENLKEIPNKEASQNGNETNDFQDKTSTKVTDVQNSPSTTDKEKFEIDMTEQCFHNIKNKILLPADKITLITLFNLESNHPLYKRTEEARTSAGLIAGKLQTFINERSTSSHTDEEKIIKQKNDIKKQIIKEIDTIKKLLADVQANEICMKANEEDDDLHIKFDWIEANMNDVILSLDNINNNGSYAPNIRSHDITNHLEHFFSEASDTLDSYGFETHINIPENAISLNYDKFTLSQVFENLISNIIVYGQAKEGPKKCNIDVQRLQDTNEIQIEVSDNGPGFSSQEDIDKAFDRGVKLDNRNSNSTGIGNNFCKNVIEEMGGTINISSYKNPNKTTFKIVLPLSSIEELSSKRA